MKMRSYDQVHALLTSDFSKTVAVMMRKYHAQVFMRVQIENNTRLGFYVPYTNGVLLKPCMISRASHIIETKPLEINEFLSIVEEHCYFHEWESVLEETLDELQDMATPYL